MSMNFDLKQFEGLKTPFYWYDSQLLDQTLQTVKSLADRHGYHVHYAVKANGNLEILRRVNAAGLGTDCVSGNEILQSIAAGIAPEKIAFAGVGKSDEEIRIGLENNIFCFNCESIPEIEVIDEIAGQMGKRAHIALRINPNVHASTHHYITTGLEENKFGINTWALDDVLKVLERTKNVELIGLHFHIGSQILDMQDFRNLCTRVNEIQEWFYARKIIVDHINVGGGLGVNYEQPDKQPIPTFEEYFKVFAESLKLRPKQQLHFELGRAIVAQCGSLITKVLYVKNGTNKKFAIVDAGFTELIRPALYQAVHKIENISSTEPEEKYDVVGPICESSDCFAKSIDLAGCHRGDLLAIRTAGAYGEAMASTYNLRTLVKGYFSK
ncbi:MAG: diaminopimelate decarboxylase [Salinivirgaceae bacterium]|nr:diaminopimelate decarboxylase [Salinivirgaceae bacterium]MBR4621522.1 diaminopimelate decarboxylase [Salinivirgaceae bacterium]